MLLLLPTELRLRVYANVFDVCSCRNQYAFDTPTHRIALNILLVNRQIYAECRALSVQLHIFNFNKWCGTGVHYCQMFLQRLRPWQVCSIRVLKLQAVENSLNNGSGIARLNLEWFDICAMLSGVVGIEPWELHLTIEGQLVDGGLKLLDIEADWVKLGLGRLNPFQRVEITIASDRIRPEVAENFKTGLTNVFSPVQIVLKKIVQGIEIYV
ncbi:hypothetical protein BDV24DRAFT_164666 [Aspergillus arachidicola]|uniref:Uncharacterized protein n=1 Tax=Aspergillus arachidicola TaxID=656916 RepID=A0A5N6Y6W9_9EURO|nr:hypothetical protein BDV24DRAFT_164666 [Aspergillus arachidicola]